MHDYRFLEAAIASAFDRTFQNWELYVLNDGSKVENFRFFMLLNC
ncbi:hypothetical protein CKA32_003439 [Geitlerinema sp. FC II]|nr:hypothetical protein CKA32_003439 [Geitlerinema sp. FC II]